MIKNPSFLKKLEVDFSRDEEKLSFKQSLKLFTSMWNEAVELGILPSGDPLEGIDVDSARTKTRKFFQVQGRQKLGKLAVFVQALDIRIAKALNSCLKSSCPK